MQSNRARGRRRAARAIASLLGATLVLTGCWGDDDDTVDTAPTSTADTIDDDTLDEPVEPADPIVTVEGVTATGDTAARLGLRLTDGEAVDAATDPVRLVDGTPLTDAEIASLLARLPDWEVPPTDQVTFERPAETLQPPAVGATIDQPFPPAEDGGDADDVPSGPLEVLRYQPEGPVEVAPFLAVTFSEPMVALGTLEQLDASADAVPVVITPQVEGRWRWIGTRTLRFELVPGELDRLPAATEYLVEVPAGTVSANGATLADSVSWTFTTPTPTLTGLVGVSDSMTTSPVWVATFDQRVDPNPVLGAITVTAGGSPVAIRQATASEVDDDDVVRHAVDQALPGRVVAFTPAAPLPVDSAVTITVGPEVPSAEGPLVSTDSERFEGRTFGALRIVDHRCSWDECVPGSSLVLELSNPLDPDAFDADLVTVDPDVPGLRIDVYGSVIELGGALQGRTTYEVTLGGELVDVFGQTLVDDRTVSFDVGPARPALSGLQREFVTVDPSAEQPTVSITTINHDAVQVRAWAVTPDQLPVFRDYLDRARSDADAEAPDWQLVYDEEVEIDGDADTFVETPIDLSRPFNTAGGQIVVRIDSLLDLSENDDDYWRNQPTVAWVQSTTLGIDAILDDERLVISTTDLLTGAPIGDLPVELLGDGRVATTDDEGLAEIELGTEGIVGLWANAGDRAALLPADWWDGWREQEHSDESRWYVFDDRGIYRPEQTARLKGWVRRFDWSDDARLALYEPDATLAYQAWDAQGVELAAGELELGALGGFDVEIDIPAGANLGPAWVEFRLDAAGGDQSYSHTFQIQEFRRPEFEVSARTESPAPHLTAEPATVAVDAEYFAGGALPDAEVSWLVSSSETSYSPPGWDEFEFGVWQPWWWEGADEVFRGGPLDGVAVEGDICIDCGPIDETTYEEFTGRTDASGTHFLQIDFERNGVDLPASVTAEATVFDIDRQAWSDRVDLLVHPAGAYVGLRSDRNFVRSGTPIGVDLVVTDIDGNVVAGRPVEVTAGRVEGRFDGSQWVDEVVDPVTCDVVSTDDPADGSMRCEFTPEVGGRYRITAVVTDEAGDENRTEITQWVSGGETSPTRDVEQETVTIVPDREDYAPGQTAELLVQAPFAPAHGVLTVIRHGIVSTEAFEAEDGSAVLELPIEDAHVPNVTVRVDMTGSAVRVDDMGEERPDLPPRPAFATGSIVLPIPPGTRTLDVTATPATAALEPGDDTTVTVAVADPAGNPVVGADVAVVVVDEAILSLTGYELVDPLDVFYREIWSAVRSRHLRSTLLLAAADEFDDGDAGRAPTVPDEDAAGGEDAADEGAAEEPASEIDTGAIEVRRSFEALAVFAPDESTGDDGTVTVDVDLPDTLTRYRVMAVAVDGAELFGTAESTITARLPLMVRAAAPRFLNYGDRFELPVVVQNQSDDPLEVDVAVQVANLELLDGAGQRVTVPANDRVEVRFPATTVSAGTARIRVVAAAAAFADASEFELPVYTPSTEEAFATYGVLDDGAVAQPVLPPSDVIDEFGGLEIGTSATALQQLTDAVLYLHEYRFESSDAYASRLLAVAALRDVLDAFDAEGLPPPDELSARVTDDIAALGALQNDDGGFPYWQRRRASIPWNSIQATHALVVARDAGYAVPAGTLDLALGYVADIERHLPGDYPEQVRRSLRAYAIHVLELAGRRDVLAATALWDEAVAADEPLEPDALAWIWPSILDPEIRDQIQRAITNAAVETAGAASIATGYTEDAFVIAQTERRTDGIVLDALVSETPDSDLVPKLVAGLLGERQRGHWSNVHENAFILLALRHYFDAFEATAPAFVARAWLGDTFVAEDEYAGRTTVRANTTIPMRDLIALTSEPADADAAPEAPLEPVPLVLEKDGDGRLYYRLGLTYAPAELELDPRDEGFVVERAYEAVDDAADVSRDADGTWRIAAGATVRVRITMVADAPRTHVALVDPLPAGLEPINPALAVSQTVPPVDDEAEPTGATDALWWWHWFEHQNLRDDRAEAFSTYLYGGTYEYTYLARATTPGTFVVPPANAQEIYSPEVFGRTATDRVLVG